ncbi:ROK family protein [Terrimonas sp.]|uniref:ROK family protein n=1 Tax=Terrimonas sp. TaxID=1914338 RepID=UPI000D512149|nr:ROK family protein [Terrimonas sp.]PVD50612.1 ROK family protein [Terrimonas sp.]
MNKAIGIDLGGTNIKGVLVDDAGNVLETVQQQTNEKQEANWKNNVSAILKTLQQKAGSTVLPVGLSAPGLAGKDNTCIVLMPGRLAGLENFVWEDHLNTPAWVLNDAHAALMAEASFGAGKGYRNIIMLTLGTGVGGGVVINGELHQGLLSRAGHLGHVMLNADSDARDVTNMPASLEDAIGDCTIQQRSFGKYSSTYDLLQDYKNGDTLATYIWLQSVKKLAVSLCAFINIISPEIIILGGGIAHAGKDLFEPLATFMDIFEWRHSGVRTPVVQAVFDEYSGAVGAAGFALHKSLK